MAIINVYLNFSGNTEEAMNFYKSVFGGEFDMVMRYGDMPEGTPHMTEDSKNKIMHMSLPISKETTLMGSDNPDSFPPLVIGTNFSISLNPDSEADAKRFFDALSAGGQITMPLEKAFWGAYFGMLTDKYGVQWMVNYQYPQE